jgi:Xaa-Pro aminopeptidase
MAKPGARPCDLRAALVKFQKEHGYFEEGGICGHGQGTDLLERPGFLDGETMALEENMFISIHPGMETRDAWGFNTDSYLVTKNGAERLNRTARGIFKI